MAEEAMEVQGANAPIEVPPLITSHTTLATEAPSYIEAHAETKPKAPQEIAEV